MNMCFMARDPWVVKSESCVIYSPQIKNENTHANWAQSINNVTKTNAIYRINPQSNLLATSKQSFK